MNIPKLAEGGIIKNVLPQHAETRELVFPINDKYYKIYKRTKNSRIKKKNLKKSFRAQIEENIKCFKKKCGLSSLVIKKC